MDITKYLEGVVTIPSAPFSLPDFGQSISRTRIANTSRLTWAMYIFFIIAILVAVGYALSLVIHIPGISPGVTLPQTGSVKWTGPETYSETANINLYTDVSDSVKPSDSTHYTVSFEMKIMEPFAGTNALRHIFHRGGAVTVTGPNGNQVPVAEQNIQEPLNLQVPGPSTTGIVMNPAVFLAAGSTNALWIFVQDNDSSIIVSTMVNGVPVYQPFRLTISVSGSVMDIYINCKLAKTVYTKGVMPAATLTEIYGHLGTDFPGILGAVRYFNVPFTAQQVALLCNIPMTLTL